MSRRKNWIEVDLDGLERTLSRRGGKVWVLHELLANVFDTNATKCALVLMPVPGKALAELIVMDDDPDGFKNLAHAYTLYAESEKKVDPTKRGRWNAGEKMVLALCEEAEIHSTTGRVVFNREGRSISNYPTAKREKGTKFRAIVRMTRPELEEALREIRLVLPPIPTTVNSEHLQARKPVDQFEVALPTESADGEGFLRRTTRKTTVRIYERREGEPGRIYEMGIPVVETEDPWMIDVGQKVPLNSDRDNVSPSFLRELRVHVVNRMHASLTPETAATPAVQAALEDRRIEPAAVEAIIVQQYGVKRAVFDPNDREANNRLVADGYRIIHGGAFSKEAWANIREVKAARPSGEIRPTPKPYSPDGEPADFIPHDEWTAGMKNLADYCIAVAYRFFKGFITVRFERGRFTAGWIANFGAGNLVFNYDRLGKAYFEQGVSDEFNDLLIHELAHNYEENHLSEGYHDACTLLGAKLTGIALREPELFKKHGWRAA